MGDLRSFFAAGKAAPIGNTRYPSGYGLTQRRHPAVPPDTTSPPSAPGKSASSGNPATRRTSFAREIRLNWKISRPETSFARKIRRPGTSFARKSASPGKSAGPTHVPAVYRRPPFIPPGTRPVRLCPAPLSFTGTFYAPFPSPQHVPRIAPPAEWHAP